MSAARETRPACADGNHVRGFNLDRRAHWCTLCGADWDSLRSKKTLFCAIFMVRTAQGWRADSLYMHHDTIEEARLEFFRSEQRVVRQVQIAPVVGYLANDEHGDSVSV